MLTLLAAFGVVFVLRGMLMFTGRTVPKGVIARLQYDREKLKGWCRGTGLVHVLWGLCAILIWAADRFEAYALYLMISMIMVTVASIITSIVTTVKYSNKT